MVLPVLLASLVVAASPTLYDTPHHQSPVRNVPGDLVVLPGADLGAGSEVVYRRVFGGATPTPPATLPSSNTANLGLLEVSTGSYVNAPDAIVARQPTVMQPRATYALWVAEEGSRGPTYSNPTLIGDPRPLWSSPGFVYETQPRAGTDRRLRVVGRNLERVFWFGVPKPAKVRLTGPSGTYDFYADPPQPALEHYVIEGELPQDMAPGDYTVSISLDWLTWYDAPEASLRVSEDPDPKPIFAITDYEDAEHPCQPGDGIDDTWCVKQALVDAALAGRGVVFFDDGTWDLGQPEDALEPGILGNNPHHGLLVPSNVDLMGTDRDLSRILKHPTWTNITVFTLLGRSDVADLHFDELVPQGEVPTQTGMLRLGNLHWTPVPQPVERVDGVGVHDCRFTNMFYAVVDGSWPIGDLLFRDNETQAYHTALYIGGDTTNPDARFALEDAVVTDNVFWPGDYVGAYDSAGVPRQGTIATQLGASRRVDFSRNLTDGTVNGGWRASHFWHMSGANEMMLVSHNVGTCTSDKAGDGEFIAFDGNHNLTGFRGAVDVVSATSSTVVSAEAWRESDPDLYGDLWAVIVDGTGGGQARRIAAYDLGAQPTIEVEPNWDVAPVAGDSKLLVTDAYWSVHTVANEVYDDALVGGCAKSNPVGPGKGGVMGWAGATFDSTIEGNVGVESDGIMSHSSYAAVEYYDYIDGNGEPAQLWMNWKATPVYASEIRGNIIDREYAWDPNPLAPSSVGGIHLWYDAEPSAPNPVMGYGVVVAHNEVYDADSGYDGSITLRNSWLMPPMPGPAYRAAVIFDNIVDGATWGVSIPHPHAHGTVLRSNVDLGASPALVEDLGTNTATLP